MTPMQSTQRGIILPVVLVLIGLLALTMAGFMFFVRAETSGTEAFSNGQQARLACESALEEAVSVLRVEKHNAQAWLDNPKRFRHALVWGAQFDRQRDPVRETNSREVIFESDEAVARAWRYCLVAPGLDEEKDTIRYGLTPENGKLNINTATDLQIEQLLTPLLAGLGVENTGELIACLLDWRDDNDDQRQGGAENAYYNTLKPPYRCKNGRFDTIEELLLVKGFNAAILYGEDVNRNGLLDPNEDDGEDSFPFYDNGDSGLDRGIAEFLTVWSREPDTALDNKARINLNADAAQIQLAMQTQLKDGELSAATMQFLTTARQQGVQLRSPADLFPGGEDEAAAGEQGQLPDESGGAQQQQEQTAQELDEGQQKADEQGGGKGDERSKTLQDGGKGQEDETEGVAPGETQAGPTRPVRSGASRGGATPRTDGSSGPQPAVPVRQPSESAGTGTGTGQRPRGGRTGTQAPPGGVPGLERGPRGGAGGGGGGPRQPLNSPITPEEMPIIMDRFTARQPGGPPMIEGLININTASPRVLGLIPGISPEAIAAIVEGRRQLDATALRTTAWPLAMGFVDAGTFKRIAPFVTTKAYQFHVEALGYADHVKLSRRMEWIIEMKGSLAQVLYQRDLTSLGFAWPIDDDEAVSTSR